MKMFFLLSTFFIYLYSVNIHAQESHGNVFNADVVFCQDKLNEEIEKLIKADDSEILMNSFNLASLKLAHKVLKLDGKGKTLEAHAREQTKKLDQEDKNNLRKKVAELYKKFGKPANISKINKIIDGLDDHNYFPKSERLSNEDSAVLMMAYEMLEPCQDSSLCINENDTAIVWFMDKIANKVESETKSSKHGNLLRTTVKIAHNTGVFSNTKELSPEQIKERITKLNQKNRKIMQEFNDRFHQKYAQCLDIMGGAACFAQAANETFQSNLNKILSELEEKSITALSNPLKVKLSDGMTINLSQNLYFNQTQVEEPKKEFNKFPNKLNLPPDIVEGDAPFTCGGKSFEAESRIKNIWSFDPLRLWNNIKNANKPWEAADRTVERKNKVIDYKADKGNKAARIMQIFGNFCPKIPINLGSVFWFKCDTFMKWIVIRYKQAEAKVCCKEQVLWKDYANIFAGSTGGIEGKVFVGIPNIVEFGGMLGASLTLNVGGGGIPEGCGKKNCISGTVIPSVYSGLYLNVGVKDKLKSAIGGEAKVSWKPYASLRQCLYPSGNLPKAQLKLSMGSIYVQGTVYAGWVFTYDFYKLLWESKKEDTFDIGIF